MVNIEILVIYVVTRDSKSLWVLIRMNKIPGNIGYEICSDSRQNYAQNISEEVL